MNNDKFSGLTKTFKSAGLDLRLMRKPPAFSSSKDVFFCSIGRRGKKAWFELWPGAKENRVEVLNINKDFKQVVLMAHEPARTFKTHEYDRTKKKMVWNERKVSSAKRKFLLGFDERDLFMAQLPERGKVTTVVQAHQALFNKSVGEQHIRQGEWFFVHVDSFLEKELNGKLVSIQHKRPLSPDGNPHRCDDLIVYPARQDETQPTMYARGRVTHMDHATVNLKGWHRVYMNTEDRRAGTNWID